MQGKAVVMSKPYVDVKFQFHSDARESPKFSMYPVTIAGFNSILMQGKATAIAIIKIVFICFNSILMQGKGQSVCGISQTVSSFQFHSDARESSR